MNTDAFAYALAGAIALAHAIVALFFFRFWKKTQDRLFAIFALAFWFLMLERMLLIQIDPAHEMRYYVFLVRLAAFVLILLAILDKNRKQATDRDGSASKVRGPSQVAR